MDDGLTTKERQRRRMSARQSALTVLANRNYDEFIEIYKAECLKRGITLTHTTRHVRLDEV